MRAASRNIQGLGMFSHHQKPSHHRKKETKLCQPALVDTAVARLGLTKQDELFSLRPFQCDKVAFSLDKIHIDYFYALWGGLQANTGQLLVAEAITCNTAMTMNNLVLVETALTGFG